MQIFKRFCKTKRSKKFDIYLEIINFFENCDKNADVLNFIYNLLEKIEATQDLAVKNNALTFIWNYLQPELLDHEYHNQGINAKHLSDEGRKELIKRLKKELSKK